MSLVGQSATIVEQFSYDPSFGDLTAVEFSRSGQLLYRYSIELRDNLGREKIRRETFASPTGPQETRLRYDYDLAGRLSKVFSCPLTGDPLCTASPVEKSSFSYDDNGNLTAFPTLLAPAYDAQDRLFSSSGSSFVNNAEGWRTQTTVSTLSFSHAYHPSGSLASTQGFQGTASYRLDPLGRRIERSAGPTPASLSFSSRFLYRDALRPAAELTSSNTLRSRFVYTSGRNVPDFFWRDGSLFRIVTDPRGSVRMVVNVVTGAVEQKMRHDAWGQVEEDTAPGFQPFGYAGGLHEPMTGMVRFGAREYDPGTGRWMQKDPIRFGGGDSNLYAYVAGDPVNDVDPTGLKVGDLFNSPGEAAYDALVQHNKTELDEERGGLIFKTKDGKFASTPVVVGPVGKGTVENFTLDTLAQIPSGGTLVGDWHTHGTNCSASMEFSADDLNNSNFRYNKYGIKFFKSPYYISWVGLPTGDMHMHVPMKGKFDLASAQKRIWRSLKVLPK